MTNRWNRKKHFLLFFSFFIFTLALWLGFAKVLFAIDEEGCLGCHGYPALGIIDSEKTIKHLYVDGKKFNSSIHYQATCRGCHTNIIDVPHSSDKKKVNCGIYCHISDLTTMENLSHDKIYKTFSSSVHGKNNQDTPTCLYCHPTNDPTKGKKSSKEIIALCASCHENKELMLKSGLSAEVVEAYQRTFHGKAVRFGNSQAAICTDCHTVHNIRKKDDAQSSIYKSNLPYTCMGKNNNQVVNNCHPKVGKKFAGSIGHFGQSSKDNQLINSLEKIYLVMIIIFLCIISLYSLLMLIRE